MPLLTDRERLEALDRSGILSRKGEDRLVSLCLTAVEVLSAAVSHVNIVTATHQVHVASYPPSSEGDIAAGDAGCPRVVLTDQVLAINDARLDPQACDQPWVTHAGMLSYLGAPIHYQGEVLGSFCVVDNKVRQWNALHITTLTELCKRVEEAILTF